MGLKKIVMFAGGGVLVACVGIGMIAAVGGGEETTEPEAPAATSTPLTAVSESTAEATATPMSPTPEATPTSTPERTVYAVGEMAEAGNYTITVHGVTDLPGSEFNKPEPGQRWIAVDVSVANVTDEQQSVSSIMQFKLVDGENRRYDPDLMAQVEAGGQMDGDLLPGDTLRGTVAFAIPEDASGLELRFTGGMWTGESIVEFDLGQ